MLYGSDWIIFQLISEIFIQIIQLSCATNVFIAAKFSVIVFSCFVVIRNGKLVWKVVWFDYYLQLNLSSRRYYYPGYLRIHQMETLKVQENQNNCIFMWPTSWGPDKSQFFCSDINLFLIDYARRKLCNKWLLLFEKNVRSVITEEKNRCSYYWRKGNRCNSKRQIKNRTLCTCRLFLLN